MATSITVYNNGGQTKNIKLKKWQSVLLVEETGVPGENH
jgi:hypothetical protein